MMETNRTRAPNWGVIRRLLSPISPSPAKTAACRCEKTPMSSFDAWISSRDGNRPIAHIFQQPCFFGARQTKGSIQDIILISVFVPSFRQIVANGIENMNGAYNHGPSCGKNIRGPSPYRGPFKPRHICNSHHVTTGEKHDLFNLTVKAYRLSIRFYGIQVASLNWGL